MAASPRTSSWQAPKRGSCRTDPNGAFKAVVARESGARKAYLSHNTPRSSSRTAAAIQAAVGTAAMPSVVVVDEALLVAGASSARRNGETWADLPGRCVVRCC